MSHILKGESRLQIWDINVCAKLCCLNSQEVKLPNKVVPVDVSFTYDGALFFVDDLGDVYEARKIFLYSFISLFTLIKFKINSIQVDLEEFAAIRRICVAALPERKLLLEEDETKDFNGHAVKTCDGFVNPCMTMSKTGALIFDSPSTIRVSCPAPLCCTIEAPK